MSGRGSECGSGPYACCRPKGRVLHRIAGKGEPLNLLVIGDSSAALRRDRQHRSRHCRPACRARVVTDRPGGRGPVAWRAAGYNSATAAQLRDFVVPNLAPGDWTHIVIAVGTNDMKNFHTARRFKAEFGGLLYALRAKWPEARVVWSPVIDMRLVPALPPLLGRVLEIRARLLNHVGTQLCVERGARRRLAAAGRGPASRLFRATASMRRKPATRRGRSTCLPFVMEEIAIEDVSETVNIMTTRGDERDLPEIAALPQSRQAQRPDDMHDHGAQGGGARSPSPMDFVPVRGFASPAFARL